MFCSYTGCKHYLFTRLLSGEMITVFLFFLDLFTKLGFVCLWYVLSITFNEPTFGFDGSLKATSELATGLHHSLLTKASEGHGDSATQHVLYVAAGFVDLMFHHTLHKEVKGVALSQFGTPNVRVGRVEEVRQPCLGLLVGIPGCRVLLPHAQPPCSLPGQSRDLPLCSEHRCSH